METVTTIGLVLLAMSLTLRWWRIVVPVAAAIFISWLIDTYTPVHSVWVTYSLMLAALVFGVFWQRKSRIIQSEEPSKVLSAEGLK